MERLCIASFLKHGHEVHLYVYQDTEGIPPGTVVRDGREILPESRIFMYREYATYAGFANFFRYKLLLEKGGWFVDADTLCLKPFEFPEQYVFSSQSYPESVNLAAIKVPRGSDIMRFAWEECERMDPAQLQWEQAGPKLISRGVDHLALRRYVAPPDVFCPVDYSQWREVLRPRKILRLSPRTRGFHLWNEMWRRSGTDKDQKWPRTCPYERWKRRFLEPGFFDRVRDLLRNGS